MSTSRELFLCFEGGIGPSEGWGKFCIRIGVCVSVISGSCVKSKESTSGFCKLETWARLAVVGCTDRSRLYKFMSPISLQCGVMKIEVMNHCKYCKIVSQGFPLDALCLASQPKARRLTQELCARSIVCTRPA